MSPATPPQIPLSYSLPRTIRLARNPVFVFQEYVKKYGDTFGLFVGGSRRSIITTDPELTQQVLQKNHRNYRKSAIQTDQLAQFIGRGLLTNDGEDWLRQRRLIQPGFHRDRLAHVVEVMNEVISERTNALARQIGQQPVVDFYPLMLETAFQIIARTIFSRGMPPDRIHELGDHITRMQEYIVYAIRLPFLQPFYKLMGKEKAMLRRREASFAMMTEQIEARQQSNDRPDDLIQMLLDSRYEDTGEPMDARRLVEETAILFVAGHETSANALSWTFYLLARHPEVYERLLAEINTGVGDAAPDLAVLRQLPYLTQVINESMRLYPPAWITDRQAIDDDVAAGYRIPKDTVVAPFIYGVHRHPGHWPDPDRFDPDRFTPQQSKARHPYAFMPFGGGPRLCIGNNFAMLEMQLVLIHFLRRFALQDENKEPVIPFPLVTLRPKPGVVLRVREM